MWCVDDLGACKSVIHWIDAVLIPTWSEGVVDVLTGAPAPVIPSPDTSASSNETAIPQEATGQPTTDGDDDSLASSIIPDFFG